MITLFRYEWKTGLKNFLIWTLSVGLMGLLCIVLYKSMEESMAEMAENFATMGSFSDAFGMSTLSIATLKGYFATEVGTIHALGSSMFAAAISTAILSKEEEGHTAEFTFTLPLSRGKVVLLKMANILVSLVLFTLCCAALYEIGFLMVGDSEIGTEFVRFMLAQLLMNIEIASICFLISATNKKSKLGVGIGVAMAFYFLDLIARVVPDLEDVKFLTPFSYCNASEIFSEIGDFGLALVTGCVIIVVSLVAAFLIYTRRDLAS